MKKDVFIDLAANGCTDCVIGLLTLENSDVDRIDENGETALMQAAAGGHVETVLALLEHGADVNKRNSKGATALKLAAMNAREEIVQILKEAGATQ